MAEIDTSIYKQNPIQPVRPLDPMQAIQMLGGLNQNALFQQTYQARQGVGDAYKDYARHNDPVLLQRDIATKGGFEAGPAVGQAVSNSQSQFKQQVDQANYLRSTVAALAAKKDLSPSDLVRWASGVARQTNAPASMISSILDEAYKIGNNPDALRRYLTTQALTAMGVGALEGEAGPPDAAGTPQQITRGEAIERRTGVIPPTAAGVTGMPTAVAPGFQEAATQSGQVMGAERARARNFASDIYPMREALTSLEKLGPTGTGPGTDELNTIKNFINTNLSWLPGAKFDPEKIKNFDEARKYLTQLAAGRASAFGHGTDQALSTALTANPNTHISNLAAVDLTKATIALCRMEQAQILDADTRGVQPGQYATWAARWATDQDPRAYMIDIMSPEQRENLRKSLKTNAQRARFKRSYETAVANGLIDAPATQPR